MTPARDTHAEKAHASRNSGGSLPFAWRAPRTSEMLRTNARPRSATCNFCRVLRFNFHKFRLWSAVLDLICLLGTDILEPS